MVHEAALGVASNEGGVGHSIPPTHFIKDPPGLVQGPKRKVHVDQIVLRKPIIPEPEFEDVGVELPPLVKGRAGSYEGREREPIGSHRLVQHLYVEEDGAGGEAAVEVASDDGIIYEGVRVREALEDTEGVIEVLVGGRRDGAEFDDAPHGVVVGGETEADELGVELAEVVGHALQLRRPRVSGRGA